MYRCPSCRTRRKDYGLFTKHLKESNHKLCRCGGYHYSHRPGSPFCVENPNSELHEAMRRDESTETLQEIREHIAFTKKGKVSKKCPF